MVDFPLFFPLLSFIFPPLSPQSERTSQRGASEGGWNVANGLHFILVARGMDISCAITYIIFISSYLYQIIT